MRARFWGLHGILSDGAQWFSPHKAKLASRNSHAPWNICQKKFKVCSLNFPPSAKKAYPEPKAFFHCPTPPLCRFGRSPAAPSENTGSCQRSYTYNPQSLSADALSINETLDKLSSALSHARDAGLIDRIIAKIALKKLTPPGDIGTHPHDISSGGQSTSPPARQWFVNND